MCKKFVIFILVYLAHQTIFAQFPGARGAGGAQQNMNMGRFYGRIIDNETGKPLEAVSVQLLQAKLDSATKQRKEVVVNGMLTNKKGEFSLENLNVMGQYKLKILALGYKLYEAQKLSFNVGAFRGGGRPNAGEGGGGMNLSMLNEIDKDLGNIKLIPEGVVMDNISVQSTIPTMRMNIDRKVFNVEKSLVAAGGNAIDVLKNVPLVAVDIDGNVSMRNASPQIFVDGRPTTLTLEQIPADAISTVELITNPSAKYDASGGGAGIINIVLKKNRKTGYNGNIRASVDSRPRPGFGADINARQGKINASASINANFRKSLSFIETKRKDFLNNNNQARIVQNNGPIGDGRFVFGRLGLDYFIDNRSTISFGANAVNGRFNNNDKIIIDRDTFYNNGAISGDLGRRTTGFTNNIKNFGGLVSFKHNFAKAGKELTFDFNYNSGRTRNETDINTQLFFNNGNPKTPILGELQNGGGNTNFYVFQLDYTEPLSKTQKIETGVRFQFRDFNTFNYNYIILPNGNKIANSTIDVNYRFDDLVSAAYVTYAQQIKKLSLQTGLRIESSRYNGSLLTTGQKFSNKFPFSLFPSFFATYKTGEKSDMQFNYSRKINRPNFFNLLPFIDYTDSLNLSVGNPALTPEFTHLMELSYQVQLPKSNSLLFTLYGKNTNDLIARYQYRDKNPASSIADSVIFNTFRNANRATTIGLEINSRNKVSKTWDMNTSFNFFNAQIDVAGLMGVQSNSQFSWFTKWNNTFKLPKSYTVQLTGEYYAKTLLPQGQGGGGGFGGGSGRGGAPGFAGGVGFGGNQANANGFIKANYYVDLSLRKEILKNNAGSLTISWNDIFRTRVNASFASNQFFEQNNLRRRDPQLVRLTFNYRFGKLDVSLFKRKNIKGETEGINGAMSGMAN